MAMTRTARAFVAASALMTSAAALADDTLRAEALAFNCFTCHGTDGRSPGAMPGLYGKSAAYLRQRLRELRAGAGAAEPTIMQRIARGYSDAEIDLIAEYLAGLGR